MNYYIYMYNPMQVDLGVLAACFNVPGETSVLPSSYCVIQLYEPMDSIGIPVQNEFDCPLYDLFRSVPSHCICHAVSVLHECTPSCVFKRVNSRKRESCCL